MLTTTALIGGGAAAAGPDVTIEFGSSDGDASNATVYTHSGMGLGTAAADRIIIVGAQGSPDAGPGTIEGVKVGGVSATELITVTDGDAIRETGLFALAVSSGTTADVEVTYNTGMFRAWAATWAIYGASITPHATASDSGTETQSDVNINVEAGGAIIVAAGATDGAAFTFVGVSEDFEVAAETQNGGGGSATFAAASTPKTVNASGASKSRNAVAASFSKA